MGLEIGRIHHRQLGVPAFTGQFHQDAGKDPQPASAHPAVIKRLGWTMGPRRILPAQPIAMDEDNPAQHRSVVHPRNTVRQRKEGLKSRHLRVSQPEWITHAAPPLMPRANQAKKTFASDPTGPDPGHFRAEQGSTRLRPRCTAGECRARHVLCEQHA